MRIESVSLFKTNLEVSHTNVIMPDLLKYYDGISSPDDLMYDTLSANYPRILINCNSYRITNLKNAIIQIQRPIYVIRNHNYVAIKNSNDYLFYFIVDIIELNDTTCELTLLYDVWANHYIDIYTKGNEEQTLKRGHIDRYEIDENNDSVAKPIFRPQTDTPLPLYDDDIKLYNSVEYKTLWLDIKSTDENGIKGNIFGLGIPGVSKPCFQYGNEYHEYIYCGVIDRKGNFIKSLVQYNTNLLFKYYIQLSQQKYHTSFPEKDMCLCASINDELFPKEIPEITVIENQIMSISYTTTPPFLNFITIEELSYEEPTVRVKINQDYVPLFRTIFKNYDPEDAPLHEQLMVTGYASYKGGTGVIKQEPNGYMTTYVDVFDGYTNLYSLNYEWINYTPFMQITDLFKTDSKLRNSTITKQNQLEYEPAFYCYPFNCVSFGINENLITCDFEVKTGDILSFDIIFKNGQSFFKRKYNNLYLDGNFIPCTNNNSLTFTTNALETYLNNSGAQHNISLSMIKFNEYATKRRASSEIIRSSIKFITDPTNGLNIGSSILDYSLAGERADMEEQMLNAKITDLSNTKDTPIQGNGNSMYMYNFPKFVIRTAIDCDEVRELKQLIFKYGYKNVISKPINHSRNAFTFVQTESYTHNLSIANPYIETIKLMFDNGFFINYCNEDNRIINRNFYKDSDNILNYEAHIFTGGN